MALAGDAAWLAIVDARRLALRNFAIGLLLAWPWLNPFAPGPSPAVMPLIHSWACAAGLLVLGSGAAPLRAPGAWLLLALACAILPSLGYSPQEAAASLLCLTTMFIGVWLGAGAARNGAAAVDILATAWLAAGLLSAVAGLSQYFGVEHLLSPWVNGSRVGEAFANLRQRNQFATLSNIALVAAFWHGSRDGSRTRLTSMAAAAVLLGVATMVSNSRTGLVQLAALCALCLLWRRPRPLLLCAVAVGGYVVALFTLPHLAGLGSGISNGSSAAVARIVYDDYGCASRRVLWSNVGDLVLQRPWLGWGWRGLAWAHYIADYGGKPRFCEILDNAHDLPLHLAVELGLPFTLLLCGAALWMAWRAGPWRETDSSRQLAWGVIAVVLLHSAVEYPLWYGPFQMAFGIALGLLARPPPAASIGSFEPTLQYSRRWHRDAAAALLLAISLYCAWDYHRVSQLYLPVQERDPAWRTDAQQRLAGRSVFSNQERFARLTTADVNAANAAELYAMATELARYSPEPAVLRKLIASARLLGLEDEAQLHEARLCAAFAQECRKTSPP